MPYKKNADGVAAYYYKKRKQKDRVIQKDWFAENGYKKDRPYPVDFYKYVERTLTRPLRAYWAFMTDGDGSIDHKYGRVKVQLTAREPIQYLADLYGTSISLCQFPEEKTYKDSYIVRLNGQRAFHFIKMICPYMIEKKHLALFLINQKEPNYHPPKIPMNFKKYPELLKIHMAMVGGFFDSEGSVGIKIRTQKWKTKTKGIRFYNSFTQWIHFSNTDLRPLRKIKKILESSPFIFKPKIYTATRKKLNKKGELQKLTYELAIPAPQHLLFMELFAPYMLIGHKKDWLEKFHMKKQITAICKK